MISFIITAKNEPYLEKTIGDLLDNLETNNAEIIAEEDDGRGQRAMINKLVAQSENDIICKVDAHCTFGPGFDRLLLEDLDERTVIAPALYPLDGETWTINHHNPMHNYAFNTKLIMEHVPSAEGKVVETMCMQGSFFMCHKKFFYEANLCDESLGSWGSQACELGIQTWYNSGRCLTSKKTYYGHVFRHKDTDFPYTRNKEDIDATYNKFINKYKDYDFRWLVEKFNYPLDWHERFNS